MPAARRPTIKDIARQAGVSGSAVSFALNGRPGVSASTRQRVQRVADQLGWRPSSAARALSGERAGAVGLVLARPASTLGVESFFLRLVSGIQEALSRHHVALLFQVVEDLDAEGALYRRWWAERRVDGVLVVDPRLSDPRFTLLAALGLPAVVVGGTETDERISSVRADDTMAMSSVIDHLYDLGHRRIVHVAGLDGLIHTERRVTCLRTEITARRMNPAHSHSVNTNYSDSEGAEATRRLLAQEHPPTAIIYDNDVMAVAGLATALELSVAVPTDLSVVAWDDSALCQVTHPRLTALTRDTSAFGALAAHELLELLDGAPARSVQSALPRLQARDSSGPAPT